MLEENITNQLPPFNSYLFAKDPDVYFGVKGLDDEDELFALADDEMFPFDYECILRQLTAGKLEVTDPAECFRPGSRKLNDVQMKPFRLETWAIAAN